NGLRVLVESNVFENEWVGQQSGYSIAVTPRGFLGSHQGPLNYTTSELTFRNNLIVHTGGAITLTADDNNDPTRPLRGFDYAVLNNIALDLSNSPLSQSPF